MIDTLDARTEALRAKAAAMAAPASRPATSPFLGLEAIRVYDDVLPDPIGYRVMACAQTFRSITVGAATFHGIAMCEDGTLPAVIQQMQPAAVPGLTFFRRSPLGQAEPNFIHTDRDMGDWTGILYLNPDPPEGDGTTFYRSKATHATASMAMGDADCHAEWLAWRDRAQWEPWHTVAAQFNRLVLFQAPLFHARAIADNYGAGDDARLTQLVFGTGVLCV